MEPTANFSQWLKKRRKALDLTQAELAKRVGCATISIQLMETGKRRPSKQMAGLIASQLNIPIEERQDFIKFARAETDDHARGMSDQTDPARLWNRFPHKPTHLPAQSTPLIGRDRDVTAAHKRLLHESTRLLTLIGPPGVGKTRLAIQIASGLVEEFEDGVHFVTLASITDPALVAPVIAQTLGVNQVCEGTFAQRLKEYLCDKHALLVLDNFEQVVNAAPFIAELLAACPWLSLIVTSRTPLSIRAERQYPVAPLELPVESNEQVDPAELLRYPAVELFVDRARSIMPDFTPDLENARMVAAICRRLDGLPLAIELAAARTNFMSLETLLEQLQNRQMLHANSLRDVSERHHTLYNAIDWSCKLLSAEEQLLLGRLSVFVNGWTMSAVETLMNDQPVAASECLRALVNNHLVIQHERRGEIRFLLLETIREYAMERLAESGEEAHVRQRHAEYFLDLAEQADPHLRTAGQLAWLERLEEERGNFRAALTWFVDICGDIEQGTRLTGALGWFWNMRSYVSEGRGWLERILPLAKKVPSAARVKALYAAGSLAWEQGELSKALAYLEESIALSRELGPDHAWDLALALGNYGNVVMYLGDQETLQRVAEESHALFSQLEDLWGMALTLCLIGETHLLKHDYQRARSCFEESTVSLRKTGDQWAVGVSLMDWGYTESLLGNMTSARAHLEESIAVHRSIGERFVRSLSLNILAQVVQQQDDAQLAIVYYGESLDLLRKMGIESSIADVQYNLACFVHAQGHYQFAKKLYGECLQIFSKQENEAGIAKCQAGLDAISDGQNRIPS